MYPQVTQIETRERLARQWLEQLRLRDAANAATRAKQSQRQFRVGLLRRIGHAS